MESLSGSPHGSETASLVDIGGIELLDSLPRKVDVRGRSFFLVEGNRGGDGPFLVSRVCPHKGSLVDEVDGEFVCPTHGKRFSRTDGRCRSSPSERLAAYPVRVEQGRVLADIAALLTERGDRADRVLPPTLSLAFHAHACMEISYDGFSLLTDPWLDGPAFYGAWRHYPPPRVSAADLAPSAIWISHEHTDHFHERSLKAFPRDIPVYVPDFPNRRMPARLKGLGFKHVQALRFGERTEIGPDVYVTVFEPTSLWNDAMVLVEAGGFRCLNLNDAGVNHRIADLVAPVDVVLTSFSPGASGYPLTWQHLSKAQKADVIEHTRLGLLAMVRSAAQIYGARYLIPFASYFALWHPDHRGYLSMLTRNLPADVDRALEGTGTEAVHILPGETWHPASGTTTHVVEREGLYDADTVFGYLDGLWDEEEFASCHPFPSGTLTRQEVAEYLLQLNDVPDMVFCENLTGVIHDLDPTGPSVAFQVTDGALRILDDPPFVPNVVIGLPGGILEHLVRENESWDEMLIGYWGKLERHPDIYHAGFWRLLQTPYYRKPAALRQADGLAGTVITDLLERHGGDADRILRRHGLYCFGCEHGTFETVEHGAWKHGLSEGQLQRLLRELTVSLPAPA